MKQLGGSGKALAVDVIQQFIIYLFLFFKTKHICFKYHNAPSAAWSAAVFFL